jgi:hypothetical protein
LFLAIGFKTLTVGDFNAAIDWTLKDDIDLTGQQAMRFREIIRQTLLGSGNLVDKDNDVTKTMFEALKSGERSMAY